jgi:transposase
VNHYNDAFVGIDTSPLRKAMAVAEDGRGGDVRFLGEIDTTEAATRKLVTKIETKYRQLTFCYEAGPTGYGIYRLIRKLGHDCLVVAPSLIPKKPGDRVKTNRRDATAGDAPSQGSGPGHPFPVKFTLVPDPPRPV